MPSVGPRLSSRSGSGSPWRPTVVSNAAASCHAPTPSSASPVPSAPAPTRSWACLPTPRHPGGWPPSRRENTASQVKRGGSCAAFEPSRAGRLASSTRSRRRSSPCERPEPAGDDAVPSNRRPPPRSRYGGTGRRVTAGRVAAQASSPAIHGRAPAYEPVWSFTSATKMGPAIPATPHAERIQP